MKYLLDTNTCIRYLNGRSPGLRARFLTVADEEIAVSSVVKAELFYGAAKSHTAQRSLARQQEFLNRFATFPFDDMAALIYGPMRAKLETAGTPIGGLDMLIAASALSRNLTLVTHKTTEFSRIGGLKLEDWEA